MQYIVQEKVTGDCTGSVTRRDCNHGLDRGYTIFSNFAGKIQFIFPAGEIENFIKFEVIKTSSWKNLQNFPK